ncbi:MAG: site-specific integrase [Emcibacteraceae bacterium]|nr:site-specific integrase [Emcibacteraceae bacterium]
MAHQNTDKLCNLITPFTYDNFNLSKENNEASERVKDYVRASSSEATLKAYKSDLEHFVAWGGILPASQEMVANYLANYAGILSVSTLTRRISALSKIHEVKRFENPTKTELVRSTMRGIRRKHHVAPKKMSPITKERLIKMLATCLEDVKDVRDRALLIVGFASALRRSELVALNCSNVEFVPEGLILNVERSKTDQQGEGRRIGIPYARGADCPVKVLRLYMDKFHLTEGPLFKSLCADGLNEARLTGHGVAYIIKQRAKLAGFDPTMFSGHSLRAGFATSAAQSGADSWAIMKQTGHKSEATLRGYIREGELFKVNAVSSVL